jgi:hypothetical protein
MSHEFVQSLPGQEEEILENEIATCHKSLSESHNRQVVDLNRTIPFDPAKHVLEECSKLKERTHVSWKHFVVFFAGNVVVEQNFSLHRPKIDGERNKGLGILVLVLDYHWFSSEELAFGVVFVDSPISLPFVLLRRFEETIPHQEDIVKNPFRNLIVMQCR